MFVDCGDLGQHGRPLLASQHEVEHRRALYVEAQMVGIERVRIDGQQCVYDVGRAAPCDFCQLFYDFEILLEDFINFKSFNGLTL